MDEPPPFNSRRQAACSAAVYARGSLARQALPKDLATFQKPGDQEMTQTIRAVFTNALAAHASYVAGLAPQDPDLATKLAEELTRHLASRVDASLTVVTQFVDPRGNGFSATVFVDTEGKRYLSFRGTNDLSDALSDLDAYLSGVELTGSVSPLPAPRATTSSARRTRFPASRWRCPPARCTRSPASRASPTASFGCVHHDGAPSWSVATHRI